jgi:hypothetical protein
MAQIVHQQDPGMSVSHVNDREGRVSQAQEKGCLIRSIHKPIKEGVQRTTMTDDGDACILVPALTTGDNLLYGLPYTRT